MVSTVNLRGIDQWLLVHHAHIWAARFPRVLLHAVGLAFISGIVSVIVLCFMNAIPDVVLFFFAIAYFAMLHEWASMQANRVMPDGPRIARPPGVDVAVGLLAFLTAAIVGAAVFGPFFGIIALERTLESSETRVRSMTRDLQLGVAYIPERQDYTLQSLEKGHLLKYGENPAVLRKYALDVIRRKDRKQLVADLTKFRDALAVTKAEPPEMDVSGCADSLLNIESMPPLIPQKIQNGTTVAELLRELIRRRPPSDCGYEQFHGTGLGEFSRHVRILAWLTREKITVLVVGVLLISIWMAVTLACNAAYGMYFIFPGISALGCAFMKLNDEQIPQDAARDQLAIYTILALWGLAAGALTAIFIAPRLRIIGADFLNTMMLTAIVFIIARFLLPSHDIVTVYPHAVAVAVVCFLLAPYGNYVRKRAGVAPQP